MSMWLHLINLVLMVRKETLTNVRVHYITIEFCSSQILYKGSSALVCLLTHLESPLYLFPSHTTVRLHGLWPLQKVLAIQFVSLIGNDGLSTELLAWTCLTLTPELDSLTSDILNQNFEVTEQDKTLEVLVAKKFVDKKDAQEPQRGLWYHEKKYWENISNS